MSWFASTRWPLRPARVRAMAEFSSITRNARETASPNNWLKCAPEFFPVKSGNIGRSSRQVNRSLAKVGTATPAFSISTAAKDAATSVIAKAGHLGQRRFSIAKQASVQMERSRTGHFRVPSAPMTPNRFTKNRRGIRHFHPQDARKLPHQHLHRGTREIGDDHGPADELRDVRNPEIRTDQKQSADKKDEHRHRLALRDVWIRGKE